MDKLPKHTSTDVQIDRLVIPDDRLRPVGEEKVRALMALIEEFGFIVPITVRRASGRITLVDGLHRTTAMQRLGRETIPAIEIDGTLAKARGVEVASNLVAGMTPLQDAIFLAEWEKVYVELHPETKGGIAGARAKHGMQRTNLSFAELVAESRQVTPRQIRRIVAAAEALTRDEARSLQGAGVRLPISDIQIIGKITDPDERLATIQKLALGAAKSASAARRAWRAEIGEDTVSLQAPEQHRDEQALKALRDGWNRCSAAVRRKFATEFGDEIIRWSDTYVEPDEAK